jgi:hypothetical protein
MFSFNIRYNIRVSRYRIYPDPAQEQALLGHCAHAMSGFFAGTHGRPSWRKAGRDEGFRITGQRGRQWDTHRAGRHWGQVRIPKAGWVKFRWSRPVPGDVKSFRITRDRAGRWHIAFALIPDPIPAPGKGQIIRIDRGVTVPTALSTGELLTTPGLSKGEQRRLARLQRKLARALTGSNRRGTVRAAIARLKAREAGRRKDWCEKLSTRLAQWFDIIRIESLNITGMTQSGERNPRGAWPQCRGQDRAEPGHPPVRMGPARPPPGGQGTGPGGKDRSRLQPAVQCVRARGPEVAREPSPLPAHRLRTRAQRGRERSQEHRRRAGGYCAGRTPGYRPCEPRTPTAAPNGVAEGISRLQAGEDVNHSTIGRAHSPCEAGGGLSGYRKDSWRRKTHRSR